MTVSTAARPQDPEKSRAYVAQGAQALADRRVDDARLAFELAVQADVDCVEAYLALSRLRFPGETYLDLLTRIHQALKPRTYVEIGVGNGASLKRTLPSTLCVGLDPALHQAKDLPPHARVIATTSNAFFAGADVAGALGFTQIALAFIDGMHLFEYALDDFCHLERHMAPDGTILLHDCIPFDQTTSHRERATRFWTGDVWRLLPALRKFRPELDITVVECAPSGLAIVRNLNPLSRLLQERRGDVLAFGQTLDFRNGAHTGAVRRVENDWRKVAPLFERARV